MVNEGDGSAGVNSAGLHSSVTGAGGVVPGGDGSGGVEGSQQQPQPGSFMAFLASRAQQQAQAQQQAAAGGAGAGAGGGARQGGGGVQGGLSAQLGRTSRPQGQ